MKANEAPEKIYLEAIYLDNGVLPNGLNYTPSPTDIEYTRTDAFIEKALKWYCLDCECNDNCKDTKCFFHNEYKRFLEGKENACPPKFEYTILNPDGSTSDKWRHRHFIRKMQDAFIEKALAYLNEKFYFNNLHYAVENNSFNCMEEMFEDFRNYMKGE